jgi:hypothetical protein
MSAFSRRCCVVGAMDIEQFQDLVDRFGEFPADWPVEFRAEAVRFLAGSPEAQDIVAEAAQLRDMFHSDIVKKAPAGLSDRIFASAARSEHWRPSSARRMPLTAIGTVLPSAAPGIGRPFVALKEWRPSYFMLATLFVIGLGLGLGLGLVPVKTSGHIDFATMFAVVGT